MTTPLDTKMKLEPAFRQQWLDALRSPEYAGRETYVKLTDGEGNFCALGLAAHTHGLNLSTVLGEADAYDWFDDLKVDYSQVWHVFDAFYTGKRMTFAQFADWLEANSEPVE